MNFSSIDIDRRAAVFRLYQQRSPDAWRLFNEKLDISWLFHDFAMDGQALAERDITRALKGEPGRHHCDAVFLAGIRNTANGIKYTRLMALEARQDLTLESIKSFHAVLKEPNDPRAGRYRKSEGPMVPYLHQITRTPSISYRLRKFVEDFGQDDQLHPVEEAALAHHEFMSVWPFDKQSSTAGRLLLNYMLLSQGYPPAIIHATNRQHYYEAICGQPSKMVSVIFDAIGITLSSAGNFFDRFEERVA